MIIPIRCFTCNHVLADKWNWYADACKKMQDDDVEEKDTGKKVHKPKNMEPTGRGEILDKLGLKRLCCRRHLLGHVDMMDLI